MALVGFDGRPTGVSITIPGGSLGDLSPDGGGYLMLYDTGGVYDARPDGIRRITSGALFATGAPAGSPWNATVTTGARRS